jgi:hypothetical protein
MQPQEPSGQTPLGRTVRIQLFWSLGLALFWVIFLWGFFSKGVYAFGLNAFIYLAGFLALFLWTMRHEGVPLKKNLVWIVPICLMILSYALYDNPFLKIVSLLALPALFILFYNDAFLAQHGRVRWSAKILEVLVWRSLSVVTHLRKAGDLIERLASKVKREPTALKRVVVGVALFLLIAVVVVIPMLSSADAQFGAYVGFVNDWLKRLLSTSLFGKFLLGVVLAISTIAALLAWARQFPPPAAETVSKHLDPIVAGIVLGGILALYALFIWVQLGHLWVGKLPVEFSQTERLVKDGFWQLLSLTILNILLTFATYRKTVPAVQRLLAGFAVASLLLLASAAYRMALYVTYYGFSYEKFFASYTVVFCAILLGWLIIRLRMRARADIIRFPVILFLWMYAILSVTPVEQVIMRSNVALSRHEGSQIRLFELTMLSPDVLNLVRRYKAAGLLEEKNPFFSREAGTSTASGAEGAFAKPNFDWSPWIKDRESQVREKAWYELNVMNLFTTR